jgi:FAD-dependent oxidoreductase family protein
MSRFVSFENGRARPTARPSVATIWFVGWLGLAALQPAAAASIEADVCIYGGTSGGVVAALQVARMGKRAVLLEPGGHLGGMTAGGLSAVDIGDPRSVGGLAREYFTRLTAHYGRRLSWDQPFHHVAGGPATGGAYSIEPHVAEQLFEEMLRSAAVPVYRQARLAAARKEGARLVELTLEDGRTVRAAMFIDATYEGDLMARAGVRYTLEREGNAKYGERYNGIYYAPKFRPRSQHQPPGANGRVPGGQGVWDRDLPLDPYVVPGNPASGLLPLIDTGDPGREGEPAPGVQAYCYRLCLTTADDRLPIEPPAAYDPYRYEIVARFIAACMANGDEIDLRWFSKYDALPNQKYDFNTATFGGNLPGASWTWPEASYARRVEIAQQHEDYHRGLLHFLATDRRVPERVRQEMRRFGLPRDEFVDGGGWPHQIYVREARRMVSDFVMTEHHTFGRQTAPHSVGLGSYGTDTHEVRRIVKDGVVTREGKTAGGRDGFGPYQIGYGAIVPRASECDNLFVTFALSASHTAFSSIRMEPVFMITSQSAATAACLALDLGVSVQDLSYEPLERRLMADKQVLAWQDASPSKTPAKAEATEPADAQSLARIRARQAAAVAVSPLAPSTAETTARPLAQAPPTREPVRLARDASPRDVDGKSFDVVVVGGTASGVACAVRAAREGCTVLLVQHNQHLGGMMTNGLMQWDALYGGPRAPLFTELLGNIERYYRTTYGENSADHQTIRYTHEHYPISWAEPHVAEREFNRLVAAEKKITLLLDHYPSAATRQATLLRSVKLRACGGTQEIEVTGRTFADATYEGDLAALAKVPFRVGREARDEYGEPHAGKVFANIDKKPAPQAAIDGRLNIRPYGSQQGEIDPTSPFTADGAVQAYNYRLCVTRDPANRIMLAEPPPGYDRNEYLHYNRKSIATNAGPNQKSHMNSPILPGENHAYPEADWPTREQISCRHRDFALGLIWFLQNDDSVKEKQRAAFRLWGLPKDEFVDHGHIPYEMYVREARRIVGRTVFTEHDNSLAKGFGRTPIMPDSVAVTDWYMDSHACTTESRPKYHYDGKLILTEESRPAQIPYRALLPREVDNLLVPVCLSATHVAWGAVRLEPVWMQTGEAAGLAAALAQRSNTTVVGLDAELLVRTLAERRHLISFFNELKVDAAEPAITAAQYFGTRGFFHDYQAALNQPLGQSMARAWAEGYAQLVAGKLDGNEQARAVARVAEADDRPITVGEFMALLPAEGVRAPIGNDVPAKQFITRGAALKVLWQLLPRLK